MKFSSLLLGLAVVALAPAQSVPPVVSAAGVPSVRLVKSKTGPETLQTRARAYLPPSGKGPTVWLIGVAHIAEPGYYKDIQALLDSQDLVLYEGVNRGGKSPVQGGANAGLNSTYGILAGAVGLVQQVQSIDYTRKNLRPSDLSWEDLTKISEAKGGKATEGLNQIGQALKADSPQAKMLVTFLESIKQDPGSQAALRLALAEGLSKSELIAGALSPGTADVILKSRNDHVFGDLQLATREFANGKSVGVFYGAAHMPDLETRLVKLGYQPGEERWFTAISADESKVTGSGTMLLGAFRAMFDNMAKRGAAATKSP